MPTRSVSFALVDGKKTCTGCFQSKDELAFSRDTRSKTGLQARCKACYNKYDSARSEYRRSQPDYHVKWHSRYLVRMYNMTRGQYLERLLSQGTCCAICKTDSPGGDKITEWAVDHDHSCCPGRTSCGKCVRALLCRSCNSGIGALGDDVNRLLAAVAYLNKHRRPS